MPYLSTLETMKLRFKAEVRCINAHILSLEKIVAMDLSKFDGKMLNVNFSKAIGFLITKQDRGDSFYGFLMYIYDVHVMTESTGCDSCVYASEYRNIKVTFNTLENRRIDIKSFKEHLQVEILRLSHRAKEYESDIRNWDTLVKRMEKKMEDLYKFKTSLNPELRSYFSEQLRKG